MKQAMERTIFCSDIIFILNFPITWCNYWLQTLLHIWGKLLPSNKFATRAHSPAAYNIKLICRDAKTKGQGGRTPPQILAHYLTLSQAGGDYTPPPPLLLVPSRFSDLPTSLRSTPSQLAVAFLFSKYSCHFWPKLWGHCSQLPFCTPIMCVDPFWKSIYTNFSSYVKVS